VAAQKLMSAVLRTGSRFGAGHLIDVLRGKATDRVRQLRHDGLPTFGVGADLDELAWRGVARQLVALGLLRADAQRYGALALTDAARPVLRGETRLELRRARPKPAAGRRAESRRDTGAAAGVDPALLDALRALRRELAQAQNVPAYVVFHDTTLHELARLRPGSESELRRISGIGEHKLERYGPRLLEVLRAAGAPAKA
jgi:ATP-dependent DNA helicase RecQ